jgi:hypothetical protein
MLICIAGMVDYSKNDSLYQLFSAGRICVTLIGAYIIDRKQHKEIKAD